MSDDPERDRAISKALKSRRARLLTAAVTPRVCKPLADPVPFVSKPKDIRLKVDVTDIITVSHARSPDPVIGKTRLGMRDEYIPTPERTIQGREDYALAYKLRCMANHKGKPNSKRVDSQQIVDKKAALARLDTIHEESAAAKEPVERKAKFTFDRSNRPARPHGARPQGWVASGCYTNPNKNR